MRRVHNLGQRWSLSSAALLAPIAVAGLGTMGVVAPPSLSLQDAREHAGRLRSETVRLERAASRFEELERENVPDRLRAARERVEGMIPDALPMLELHALVRAAAEAVGMDLEAIVIGPTEDPGLERLGDYVGMRRVSVRGAGAVTHLEELVEVLRRLGLPVAVADFRFSAMGGSEERGDYGLELAFDVFERTDPPAAEESAEEGAAAFPGEIPQ